MPAMEPMERAEQGWPQALGEPDASGSQSGLHYAYFAAARRLAVRRGDGGGGRTTLYDTGDHRIGGVAQSERGEEQDAEFTSQHGVVPLSDLKVVDQ